MPSLRDLSFYGSTPLSNAYPHPHPQTPGGVTGIDEVEGLMVRGGEISFSQFFGGAAIIRVVGREGVEKNGVGMGEGTPKKI